MATTRADIVTNITTAVFISFDLSLIVTVGNSAENH